MESGIRLMIAALCIGASAVPASAAANPGAGIQEHRGTAPMTSMAGDRAIPDGAVPRPDEFAAPQDEERDLVNLPDQARVRILGWATRTTGNRFAGTLYNDTEEWTVHEVVIGIYDRTKHYFDVRAYSVDLHLPPLQTRPFEIDIIRTEGDQYGWLVLGARGYRN